MATAPDIRASVFIATSLDGFIARDNGGIDWLDQANGTVTPGEDCGYKAFISSVDVLVMGRGSFEKVLTLGPWFYGELRVVVLSRTGVEIPEALAKSVSVSGEAPRALMERLAAEGARHVYVDGGLVIQSFLREGLIDEMIVTTIPVLIGSGKRLFGELPGDVWLSHRSTIAYSFGFVQSKYCVKRGG
ncbi:MAG: dihydrofolate reductase family protein [Polyangiaceae bacterium]